MCSTILLNNDDINGYRVPNSLQQHLTEKMNLQVKLHEQVRQSDANMERKSCMITQLGLLDFAVGLKDSICSSIACEMSWENFEEIQVTEVLTDKKRNFATPMRMTLRLGYIIELYSLSKGQV